MREELAWWHGELVAWLEAEGFYYTAGRGADAGYYRRGRVVVAVEDVGHYKVTAFDLRYPRADATAWDARFANAPWPLVRAAAQWALDEEAAGRLPQ